MILLYEYPIVCLFQSVHIMLLCTRDFAPQWIDQNYFCSSEVYITPLQFKYCTTIVPPMVSPANICIFLQELQKQHSKLQLALFFSWLMMANGKNKENEWLKDRTLKCAYSFIVVIWKTSFSCCCQGLGFEGDGRNLFCLLGFTRIMTNMVNNTLIMCHEV